MRGTQRVVVAAVIALGFVSVAEPAGAGVPNRQPDARIRLGDGPWTGDNLYPSDGLAGASAPLPDPATFDIRVQNDGTKIDSFRIKGLAIQNSSKKTVIDAGEITVQFLLGGQDVTEKVAAGKLKFHDVAPGALSPKLRMIVTSEDGTTTGGGVVFATSIKQPAQQDAVAGALADPGAP
ncbi:MAG: hypothetical protein ACRDWD_08120 [Acidimicrobiia bacterium]